MRIARLAAPLAVFAVLTSACASGNASESENLGPVKVGAIPIMATAKDKTLPIEEYLLSGRQLAQIQVAINSLETRCMTRFGYRYAPAAPDLASPITQTARRYGVSDVSEAASLGYHAPAAFKRDKTGGSMSPEEIQVLTGGVGPEGSKPSSPAVSTIVSGQPIPEGGCVAEAISKVHPERGIKETEIAADINLGDFQRSTEDPRVKQVFSSWSSCMKEKGYTYATPMDAINDRKWATSDPSKEEIDTATADIECKTKTNVIGVWFTVETAMQVHDIGAKLEALKKVKEGNEAALKRAAQVASSN